jgi:hypothetical protein
VTVTLTDNNPAATVPPFVSIPASESAASFDISTTATDSVKAGTITAKLGASQARAQLIVRPIGVLSLSLRPNPVVGPNYVTGAVTLERPAPAGGINVALSSSRPAIASPVLSSITIPAGSRSKTFRVRTADVTASRTAVIKAIANGIGKGQSLTVN